MTTEPKRHADGVETWLPVIGYEGLYEVSDLGRVRRMCASYGRASEPIVVTAKRAGCAYLAAQLTNGKRRREYVHRLVLAAFVGPAPKGHQCAHLDGDKRNNRLDNLCWATISENAEHRREHGTMILGENHANAKLNGAAVRAIRALSGRVNATAVARRFGVSRTLIRKIRAGEGWSHV